MNKLKIFIFSGVLGCLLFSCADESLSPIITFDQAEKGAYIRLIEEGDKLVNLFDISGSVYNYSVEFIDLEDGDLVAEYNLDLTYEGVDGTTAGPVRYKSFSPSDFTTTEAGLKGVTNISIPASDFISALGLKEDDIMPGDNFAFDGSIVLTTGAVFGAENSSATVRGAAFRGHFDYNLPAGCPSDLTGSYSYVTTDVWCDGSTVEGSLEIVAQGGGVYNLSDWSLGAYGPCYGAIAAQPTITFTDVCAEVSFTGFTDSYGDTWTFDSSIDGAEWTINWENTYGESANSVLIHPSGEWPFTLK